MRSRGFFFFTVAKLLGSVSIIGAPIAGFFFFFFEEIVFCGSPSTMVHRPYFIELRLFFTFSDFCLFELVKKYGFCLSDIVIFR